MDMLERIEMNIRIEAQQYIEKRIPLPIRSNADIVARRDAYVQKFKAEYELKHGTWSAILIPWTSAQRNSIKVNMVNQLKKLADKFNLLPEEADAWMDWAESLYEISSTFEVRSYAKVRGENKSWQYNNDADAEAKIGRLIAYKINDRLYKDMDVTADVSGVRELILPK
jgi:hypothetical protein